MLQSCDTCKWVGTAGKWRECHFPLPIWLLRELHHPLTGGGELVRVVKTEHGENCATYEPLATAAIEDEEGVEG